jgi:glutamyl-tRNA reductase
MGGVAGLQGQSCKGMRHQFGSPALLQQTGRCKAAFRHRQRMQHVSAALTKVPASHKAASKAALEQLRSASMDGGNRYTMEKKSTIIAIGLTVHNTPVEIREKLAVPEAEWPRAIAELTSFPHIEEAAVLSTCNRMELYVVALSQRRGTREVEEWMSQASGVPLEELRQYMFLYHDGEATEHIMRVSGGLDSLVMGEGQILAQVKQVYNVGLESPGFGRQLTALFRQAVTAGKRVRSETTIASGAVSVSSAAAELAQLKLPSHDWSDAKVCVIGAGKMSRLLLKHMAAKGCKSLVMLNRSRPRAEQLAEEFPEVNVDIRLMDQLDASIAECDTIFAASSSEDILISRASLEGLPPASAAVGGMRRFFDISVPRNIASDVNQLDGAAHVYNVDDLKEVVAANTASRQRAAREAEVLLAEEQRDFESWRDSLATVPTIKALRAKAEAIRSSELERTMSRLPDSLSKKERRAVEDCTKSIVNKLLHGCMASLRCDGSDSAAVSEMLDNMTALERMFDLSSQLDLAESARVKK